LPERGGGGNRRAAYDAHAPSDPRDQHQIPVAVRKPEDTGMLDVEARRHHRRCVGDERFDVMSFEGELPIHRNRLLLQSVSSDGVLGNFRWRDIDHQCVASFDPA